MKKLRPIIFIWLIVNSQLLIIDSFADELSVVRSQISDTKKQDAVIAEKIKDNEKLVLRTRRELVKTADELAKLEDETSSVDSRIKALEKKRDALAAQIAENSRNLSDAAAGLLEIGAASVSFDEADSSDYILRMSLLSGISEQFDIDMKIAAAQIRELEKLKSELKKQQGIFESAQKKRKSEQGELDKLMRARAAQNQQLRGRQYELQKKLNDLSARAKNLSDLADKVAPLDSYPDSISTKSIAFKGGKMKFPVSGMLLLKFGDTGASGLKSDGWRVRTRPNALVVAPADGKVEFSDRFRGYNRIAIINHNNGYYSVLTGMGALDVLVGQDVLAGEPIGRMPDSSPEIYLELRKGTHAVNPARLFMEPR
jgi:septal ring factor EnvC (AmiA/AmiB activator)